jgi:hypothetical protein
MTRENQNKRIKTSGSSMNYFIIAIIVLLVAITIAAGLFFMGGKKELPITEEEVETFTIPPASGPGKVESLTETKNKTEQGDSAPDNAENINNIINQDSGAENVLEIIESSEPDAGEKLANQILQFFEQLDQKEYIKSYKLKGASQQHLNRLLIKLFANPPVVARESDNLYSIIKNTAHLYRNLGKNNILLLQDILVNEKRDLESIMALFYSWSEIGKPGKKSGVSISLPTRELYEYAGYFLNTMGGQAYLFRRDGKVRLLVKYYCTLILDRANDETLNRHGVDIRYSISTLLEEVANANNLENKELYLEKLENLKLKYL